jgi:hypothetical protein
MWGIPMDASERRASVVTLGRRIDSLCERFESAWQSGTRPRLEDFLAEVEEESQGRAFVELLRLEVRLRRGNQQEVDPSDYLVRFSNFASAIFDICCQSHFSNATVERSPNIDLQTASIETHGDCDPTLTFVHKKADGALQSWGNARSQSPSALVLSKGSVIDSRYRIEDKIGQGGMGVVFRARDLRLDREVAVKFILLQYERRIEREISRAQELFADEARMSASLLHPAIATLFDYGFYRDRPFAVFEYVHGETLRDVLRRCGQIPLEDVQLIVSQLAQALDYAHSRHIVHRDIKPENIRVTEHAQYKVLDFGLAKRFLDSDDWRFSGTPAYASPEQVLEQPSDGRTDQYALALIAYEMLTGTRPFRG